MLFVRRNVVCAFLGVGGLVVILAVALASVGTEMDQLRIEREDFQFEMDRLQQQVDALTGEKVALQQQVEKQRATVEDQHETIKRWRAELERLRNGHAHHDEAGAPFTDAQSAAPVE